MDMNVSDLNVIPGLPQGARYRDLPEDMQSVMFEQTFMTTLLIDVFKLMGLSDKTILIIEQDMRNSRLKGDIDAKRLENDKKRKARESSKKKQTTLSPAPKEVN